jgi:hypothetical protein
MPAKCRRLLIAGYPACLVARPASFLDGATPAQIAEQIFPVENRKIKKADDRTENGTENRIQQTHASLLCLDHVSRRI